MLSRIIPLCLFITACSSQSSNLNDVRIGSMNEQILVQTDRIVELERMITELNQRVEKVEFVYLEKRDQIVSEKKNVDPILNGESVDSQIVQGSEVNDAPVLNTKISNRTSAIVPLTVMEADRGILSTLDTSSLEYKNFELAFSHLEQNQFANAWRALEELNNTKLSSDWLARLFFWKAICFEAMREEKKAISLYSELQAKFPKEERAPLALYRQASLFLRVNQKDLGKMTFQKLIKDYPRSAEANQAKSRLQELK